MFPAANSMQQIIQQELQLLRSMFGRKHKLAEVNASDLHLGGTWLESQQEHKLFCVIFLSPFRK
jgi:hypothetical protein